ncbi:alpha/beta hydrolase [Rheinheimera sediminis]|uniref:alpha/beta fold hydrolase n=1 Tax=Rheinheimera sp. YQF-1 TaxID=2499626 RepID=UPI000FD9C6E1|nr:alpha/beta hydrolase [Rheinheimera sp. YQF-1]RVT45209.1 alpha/beta hydrolase [Rheinheimera sp. YQF-1]
MELTPWSYATQYGFTLRGFYTTPSAKPVLHILHGNGYCSRMYQPFLAQLVPYFDLFLSDAQGHGDSDHGGDFIGWNQSADLALDAWLAHKDLFGNVPCYAVGHSFGGVLTALINSKQSSPFDAVVLLDPVLFTPGMLVLMQSLDWLGLYKKNPMAKKALKRRQHWPDKDSAYAYLHQRGMFKNWQDEALASYIDHALLHSSDGLKLKCAAEREAEIFASYPKQLWTQLKQPCSPTLLVYGQTTYGFVSKSAKKWHLLNHSIQLRKVTGGHCFMQEKPNESSGLIRDFLFALRKDEIC